MQEQFGELGKSQYCFGKSKMFMDNEIITALEEARVRAQSKKNEAANLIQDAYFAYKPRQNYKVKAAKIIKLQRFYRKYHSKRVTFAALKFINRMEKPLITYRTEKRRVFEEKACKQIATAIRANAIKDTILRGIKGRKKMLSGLLKLSGRKKIKKVMLIIHIVLGTFKKAWSQITGKMIHEASFTLGRMCKGCLARKSFAEQIVKAREAAYYLF